jgi:hypothetical protein
LHAQGYRSAQEQPAVGSDGLADDIAGIV